MATSDLPRDDLAAVLRALEARIARLERRSAFDNTGLTVTAPGVIVVSATGVIQSSNYVPGVSGWRLDGVTGTGHSAF